MFRKPILACALFIGLAGSLAGCNEPAGYGYGYGAAPIVAAPSTAARIMAAAGIMAAADITALRTGARSTGLAPMAIVMESMPAAPDTVTADIMAATTAVIMAPIAAATTEASTAGSRFGETAEKAGRTASLRLALPGDNPPPTPRAPRSVKVSPRVMRDSAFWGGFPIPSPEALSGRRDDDWQADLFIRVPGGPRRRVSGVQFPIRWLWGRLPGWLRTG